MRKYILYKDTVGLVINNGAGEFVRIEYEDTSNKLRKMWVPTEECAIITKEVADIIISAK